MTEHSRRRFIKQAGAGLATILAGCLGQDSTSTESPAESPTETTPPATATDASTTVPSPTTTSTTTPVDRAAVAQQFVAQLASGEYDEAASRLSSFGETSVNTSVSSAVLRGEPFDDLAVALERLWLGLQSQSGTFQQVRETTTGAEVAVTVECEFADQPLTLGVSDGGEINDVSFTAEYTPPAYSSPDIFEERSISFESADGTFEGTLTQPTEIQNPPVVVLAQAAGIRGRNATVGPNQIFKDIAYGLATQGVAVYRFEKQSSFPDQDFSVENLVVDETLAALNRMETVSGIDNERIFLVGHSLGGIFAPMIAARHGGLAGMANLDGAAGGPFESQLKVYRLYLDQEWRAERERDIIQTRIDRAMELKEEGIPDSDGPIFGFPPAYMRSWVEYDKAETAQEVSIPAFVGQNGRAPSEEFAQQNLEQWRSILGSEQTTTVLYPGLNHYCQPGKGIEIAAGLRLFHNNVSEALITDLASWVADNG